jgi:hypothetical protein
VQSYYVTLGDGTLPPTAVDTGDFILFTDMVFDSINESRIQPEEGKPLRVAVTEGSVHKDFWCEAIKGFSGVKFFTDRREFVPPSVKNWILTLRDFIFIWKRLGLEFLCPRNLNQDPLENFFRCIKVMAGEMLTLPVMLLLLHSRVLL